MNDDLQHLQLLSYCMVMAGVECCFVPFGTILGVFTLVVLLRPSVKMLFDQGAPQNDLVSSAPWPGTPGSFCRKLAPTARLADNGVPCKFLYFHR